MAARISVDILTGFLGSGKTTLLNRLLTAGGFTNTAVVVNELGEIGLDHLLVEQSSDQIALLEGGCLCCAVVDSLPETLLELCRKRSGGEVPAFDRIVIETTGLADPGPIAEMVRRSPLLAHFMAPGVVVTAFDALDGFDLIVRHPEAMMQVVLADRLVLTKLDARDPWRDDEHVRIMALNPLAEIVTANDIIADPGRLVDGTQISPNRTEMEVHHSHGVHAYNFPIAEPVTRAGLAAWSTVLTHRLGDALLRCKGIVRVGTQPILVQGVGKRFSFEDAPPTAASAAPSLTCIIQDEDRETIAATLPWLHIPEGTQPPLPEEIQ